MDNKNLGKEVFDRTYDPSFIEGWGVASVQLGPGRVGPAGSGAARLGERRLLPQLVGQLVHRRQPRERAGGLDAVQHHGAGRCAAAGWRRPDDRRPVQPRADARSARSTSWATNSKNFAEQTENWQGVDVGVSARLRNGLTVQGGTSTGRRLSDSCALKAVVPEQGEGTRGRHDVDRRRLAGEPVLPRGRAVPDVDPGARDVHDSADRRPGERHLAQRPGRRPGGELRGDQRVIAANATLGRESLGAANVTVNLIEPHTFYAPIGGTTSTCASRRSSGTAGRGRRSALTSTT